MKVTLENTSKVVELIVNGQAIPARIWEGSTANGIRCHFYVTRVAVANDDDSREFDHDLQRQKDPSAEIAAIPLRLIL